MYTIFKDDFGVSKGVEPANWHAEMNSDLPFSGFETDNHAITLYSPGNKFSPITVPFIDGEITFNLHVELEENTVFSNRFEIIICFRYDMFTRKGECVRLIGNLNDPVQYLEYGLNIDNKFVPKKKIEFSCNNDFFLNAIPVTLCLKERQIRISFGNVNAEFEGVCDVVPGIVAISRGKMFCNAIISQVEISSSQKVPDPVLSTAFRITLPEETVMNPLFCDVTLSDYDSFIEVDLSLGGGVRDTPCADGDGHSIRTDILLNPYIKLLTMDTSDKYTLYNGKILWCPEEMEIMEWMYRKLQKKVPHPLKKTLRFVKPSGAYLLAVGAEEFRNNVCCPQQVAPMETLFTPKGDVLSSGLAISDGITKINFFSQQNKEIIKRLPKDDPQYEKAVTFARNNHYFMEGESIHFNIELFSRIAIPFTMDFTLENVFFEPLMKLTPEMSLETVNIGFMTFEKALYSIRLTDLSPGVYHLRAVSRDASCPELEDYCAFEVMSRDVSSQPPPIISGLPFLYCGRTETRGLETDSFDPWHGSSVDSGHYMACTNFLPDWVRKHSIVPTLKAYQRDWFCWMNSRCLNDPSIDNNKELIEQADFLNYDTDLLCVNSTSIGTYKGIMLDVFLDFAKESGDKKFNLEKLKEIVVSGGCLDRETFRYLAMNYWPQWLDYRETHIREKVETIHQKVKEINQDVKYASYGPAPMYAARYKGVDFTKYRVQPPAEYMGFFQFEDYPFVCRYGIESGTYLLTSCLLAMPGVKIYPEIYTAGGFWGCPDGAVHYAYPPYGVCPDVPKQLNKRRVYDYALASAYFSKDGFDYWRDCGFQANKFNRPRYETLIEAWRTVHNYPPARPLKSSAFVWSSESYQCVESGKTHICDYGFKIDVRTTRTEDVPFAYEEARKNHLAAGFLTDMSSIEFLSENDVDTLVLPPLKGVSPEYINTIRELHAKGVNLVAFENVPGLEDLFGICDSGKETPVTTLKAVDDFLDGMTEFTNESQCSGRYRENGATVLINAEIPALTLRKNKNASAAFFNVPPTLVNDDRHDQRILSGLSSISPLMNSAIAEIMKMFSGSPVKSSAGRLIAYKAQNGETVVIITNPDEEKFIIPIVTLKKDYTEQKLHSCDCAYTILEKNEEEIKIRLKLPKEESTVIIFK
jgi:hypothetical protein